MARAFPVFIPSILFCFGLISSGLSEEYEHKEVLILMGTRFEITAISDEEAKARQGVELAIAEIIRIEKLISSWDPNSRTSEIVRNAGIKPVIVEQELYDLIYRSLKISQLTNGAFDISFAAAANLWDFDGGGKELPAPDLVQASVDKINYRNILLNPEESSVFLKEEGMKIGFGAIGKGYAANQAMNKMKAFGIAGGVVNASGDLITWGKGKDGDNWKVGIADPRDINKVFSWLTVNDMAVVTSGDFAKYFIAGGIRYSHIIDPRTGYPTTGIKSVTVICPDAELADALATSVFVLGVEQGLDLINRLKNIECLIVDDDDNMRNSNNLKLNHYNSSKAIVAVK